MYYNYFHFIGYRDPEKSSNTPRVTELKMSNELQSNYLVE